MPLRGWLTLFVLGILLVAQDARAAPVTWVFEGTIAGTFSGFPLIPVEVPELSSLGVVEGTPFVATFTIERDTPDLNASATFGRFQDAVLGVSFEAAGYGFSFSGPASYSQLNVNVDLQILGAYYSGNGEFSYFDSPLVFLEVEAAQPGVFASDAIPEPFPPIGSLLPLLPELDPSTAYGYGSWLVIHGRSSYLVASLSTHYAVPEPLAGAGVAAGLLALAALRSRRPS